MKKINAYEVLRLLTKAVNLKGEDYVYPRKSSGMACHYAFNGEPDCIVGHVLVDLGIPVEDLMFRPGALTAADIARGSIGTNFADLEAWYGLKFTKTAEEMLVKAQFCQDIQHTWGWALEEARKAL